MIGESKKYECPHCGLESITNSHIRKHINEVHERKKNFYCRYKDYTKKLRDDDICSEVGCILYRMKT